MGLGQEVRADGRRPVRVGQVDDGQAQLHLRQRGLQGGHRGLLQAGEGRPGRGGPDQPRGEPQPVHRDPVHRHPRVPRPRDPGVAADLVGHRRQDHASTRRSPPRRSWPNRWAPRTADRTTHPPAPGRVVPRATRPGPHPTAREGAPPVPDLRQATLTQALPGTAVPAYDRSTVSVGMVHIGVGGFHRSHQAVYLDDLLATDPAARSFGLCGVSLLEQDRRVVEVMNDQDTLYTVLVREPDGSRHARVVGSVVEHLFAPDDPGLVLDADERPDDQDRLADDHGGRLLLPARRRHRRPVLRRPAARRPAPGRPAHRLRLPRRRAATAAGRGCRPLHGALVRQRARQRRHHPPRGHRARGRAGPRPGCVGRGARLLPQRHGRPHHPSHRRRRPGRRSPR